MSKAMRRARACHILCVVLANARTHNHHCLLELEAVGHRAKTRPPCSANARGTVAEHRIELGLVGSLAPTSAINSCTQGRSTVRFTNSCGLGLANLKVNLLETTASDCDVDRHLSSGPADPRHSKTACRPSSAHRSGSFEPRGLSIFGQTDEPHFSEMSL